MVVRMIVMNDGNVEKYQVRIQERGGYYYHLRQNIVFICRLLFIFLSVLCLLKENQGNNHDRYFRKVALLILKGRLMSG